MPDIIPISVDEREFTFWNWLGFLSLFSFITLHFAALAIPILGSIWETVWLGDFSVTDVIWAVGLTIIAVPALVAVYSIPYTSAFAEEPFSRVSVLLDTNSGCLILRDRHVSGFCSDRSLSVADIKDLRVTWNRDEDGNETPETRLLTKGKPVIVAVTNPADTDDATAFAARFRAHLAAIGWSDERE